MRVGLEGGDERVRRVAGDEEGVMVGEERLEGRDGVGDGGGGVVFVVDGWRA